MRIPILKRTTRTTIVRFIFFCRGVLETLKRLGWQPDIIHCNDWQTGLIPAYIKTIYSDDPFFKHIKPVFTIHNLAYQGTFPASSFEKTGLPESEFTTEGVEVYGKLNFMKSGLVYSDVITIVSENTQKRFALPKSSGAVWRERCRRRNRTSTASSTASITVFGIPKRMSILPSALTSERLKEKWRTRKSFFQNSA